MSKEINEKYRKEMKEIKSRLHVGDEYSPPSADSLIMSKSIKKQSVIALKLHTGEITAFGQTMQLPLPPGCKGIMFMFENKEMAKKYWGKDIKFVEVEEIDNEGHI